jgi:hypothetical protein
MFTALFTAEGAEVIAEEPREDLNGGSYFAYPKMN